MNKILVDLYLRLYKNNKDEREALGVFSSIIGIVTNLALFVIKVVIGSGINSIAIITDAFNSLSDGVTSIVSLLGIKVANKPADEEHPFGHGRMEYIASLVIAFFIMILCWNFFISSIQKIISGETVQYNAITMILLVGAVLAKVWLYFFNTYIGKKINSKVLLLTAKDSLNDVIITSVTIFSILFTHYTSFVIDGYVGLLVTFLLFMQGIEILKETISPILGEASNKEMTKEIKKFIEKYDGILGTHDMIIHNYGPTCNFCTVHAEVPSRMDLSEAHNICDKIERDLKKEMDINLTIHIDPIDIDNEHLKNIITKINQVTESIEIVCNPHDFRLVEHSNGTNVIFELEVPYKTSKKDIQEIEQKYVKEIKQYNNKANVIINLEHSFII